jgi:hypothetical protein
MAGRAKARRLHNLLESQLDGPVLLGVGNGCAHGVGLGVVLPVAGGLLADVEFFGFGGGAEDGYAGGLPPWWEAVFFCCGAYCD